MVARAHLRHALLASLLGMSSLVLAGCDSGDLTTEDAGGDASGSGGASGTTGTAGGSGTTGSAGTTASAGTTGAAGTGGGAAGRGGTTGTAGTGGGAAGRGGTTGTAGTGGGAAGRGGTTGTAGTGGGQGGSAGRGGTTGTAGAGGGTAGRGGSGGGAGQGALPAGWLFTSGNKVHVSDGNGGGPVWVGRGVNVDDIFFCGYNNTLWMTSPEQTVNTMVSGLMSGWKPTFVRISLSMASFQTVSWLTNPAQYKTPMTSVINGLASRPGVYVLVTLRSDASMIGQDNTHGDPEATGIPSDSTTTPDRTAFPMGTDPLYVALVDSFASSPNVLFGLTNEPGGNLLSNATIAAAMRHGVDTIRAEEDRLGVPHHIISVQGQGWTGDISYYATAPFARDNIVYEVHGYPPPTTSYTYPNIPVIIGEYGSLTAGSSATAFFNDIESKQIPSLAWDFDPYSDCAPDLVSVTHSATSLTPTAWGMIVQPYLLAH